MIYHKTINKILNFMGIIYRFVANHDSAVKQVEELYTSAFPPDERRDFEVFASLLADDSVPFSVLGAFDDGGERLLSFISFWELPGGMMYLEHFAVIPQMRGMGIGRTVFSHFLDEVASTIVLEVEPPVDVIAVKRIRFYESLGLKLWGDFAYVQPPYGSDKSPLELKLMTHGDVSQPMLEKAVAEVRRLVYGCKASAE